VATRDWHPSDHCSFQDRGGPWPPHCVAHGPGAAFADDLELPRGTLVVDKATRADRDAYSGFQETGLAARLRALGVERVVVGGLATDYCILSTVLDALEEGFRVVVLANAVRAVDAAPGDGARALARMRSAGARLTHWPGAGAAA